MSNEQVKVPFDNGDITITVAGGEPRTWRVLDGGLVSPANEAERDLLLTHIDGAKTVPATTRKKE